MCVYMPTVGVCVCVCACACVCVCVWHNCLYTYTHTQELISAVEYMNSFIVATISMSKLKEKQLDTGQAIYPKKYELSYKSYSSNNLWWFGREGVMFHSNGLLTVKFSLLHYSHCIVIS